ncbi:ArsR/SmtB family transcription factor [Methylomicrobium lacus]|uniref:ArsR/SmtB family transcription factor n=1 Tax=Methylomicrobium lacus TaxID=136992 RepID=UPI0035A8ABB8
MDKQLATTLFESLASGVRLDVFRLLVKRAPTGLVAGEISSLLALPPTNLSFHLKAMTHAGLVSVTQEGRYQRYRANLAVMQDLIVYMTAECCAGHPEQCFESQSTAVLSDTNPSPSDQIDSYL